MALLWVDGFDHYGTVARLLDGPYAETTAVSSISTSNVRTGANSLLCFSNATLRRVLGGAKTFVGIGGAFYFTGLPIANQAQRIFDFRDATNFQQIVIWAQSTGTVSAYRGATHLGTSAAPVITANTYQHIECQILFSQTVGTIEVRVNGVTVLSLSGQDTCASALVEASQVAFAGGTGSGSNCYLDDIYAYDNTGSYNNTWIGDRRVLTLFPNANTATADWTAVGAATGYECIDEANPNDDTDYINATASGKISQFGLQNTPAGVSAISGVVMVERSRKTEAGIGNTKMSIVSGASTTAGADKPLTEVYTYRQDVFETDPATAAPFTPSGVDSLQFKVERTA